MLRSIEQLNRCFPADLLRGMQAIQRLAPIYQKWIQGGSAFYGNRVHEVESPRRKWSVESDPNIPDEFKRRYRTELGADHRLRKARRFWELLRSGRRRALIEEFEAPYDSKRDFYTAELGAVCQYLDLAEQYFYSCEPRAVTKGELWQRVSEMHRRYSRWRYKQNCQNPSPRTRARVLKEIGLSSLPESPGGRPQNW
jgi:hypothetical protein